MADDSKEDVVPAWVLRKLGLPADGKWFFHQEPAVDFQNSPEGSNYKCKFAWDNPFAKREGSKIYGVFRTVEDFWKILHAVPPKKIHAYEWLEDGTFIKLYGDVEWKVEVKDPDRIVEEFAAAKEEGRKTMEKWMQQHRNEFKRISGISLIYLILEGSRIKEDGSIKLSYHVIIQNLCFYNDADRRKLVYKLMCLAPGILPTEKAMDPSPYGVNQKYRTNHSSKGSDESHTPLKICPTLSEDPHSISDLDTLVGHVPESTLTIDELLGNDELQRLWAECVGKGNAWHQSCSRVDAKHRSQDPSTSIEASSYGNIDSLHKELKTILLLLGDSENQVGQPKPNKIIPNGFIVQCYNPKAGRSCLWNPFNVHHTNNSRMFVEPVDENLKVFAVKSTCTSGKCHAPNGKCRTGVIAWLMLDEDQTFHLHDLDESLFERALKTKVLSLLRRHFADDTGGSAIKSSKVRKDLEKELSVETGFLIEYTERIASWIRTWADCANSEKDKAQSGTKVPARDDNISSCCTPSSSQLTSEQTARIELNRAAALVRKGQRGVKSASGRMELDHMEEVDDGDKGSKDADKGNVDESNQMKKEELEEISGLGPMDVDEKNRELSFKLLKDDSLQAKLHSILKTADLASFTKREARLELEKAFSLEDGGLDNRKEEIAGWIQEYVNNLKHDTQVEEPPKAAADSKAKSEGGEEDSKAPVKAAKTTKGGNEGAQSADEKGCNQGGHRGSSVWGGGRGNGGIRGRRGGGPPDGDDVDDDCDRDGNDGGCDEGMDEEFKNPSYLQVKTKFENECFKINDPFCYVRLAQQQSDSTMAQRFSFLKHTEFRQFNSHLSYYTEVSSKKGGTKRIRKDFIDLWIRDPTKRVFEGIETHPLQTTPGYFNIWPGFLAARLPPVDEADVEELVRPWIKHYRDVFAHGEDQMTEFLIDHSANMLKRPDKPSHVIILIEGEQGCGKDINYDFLRECVIGEECSCQTDNPEQNIFGKHASCWINKVLVQVSEAKAFYQLDERLKNAVVAKKRPYEPKGKTEMFLLNMCNFVVTTNNKNVIRLASKERRTVWIRASEVYLQNEKYFADLGEHYKNPRVARAVYQFLMERDLSKYPFDFQKQRPITEAYREQQSLVIPLIKRYVSAIINDLTKQEGQSENGEYELQNSQHMYEQCKAYAGIMGIGFTFSQPGFGKEMTHMRGFESRKSNGRMIYKVNSIVAKSALQEANEYDEDATFEHLEPRFRVNNLSSYIFTLQDERPITAAYRPTQSLDIPLIKRYASAIINDVTKKECQSVNVVHELRNSQHMHDQCKAYARIMGVLFPYSLTGFGKEMSKLPGFSSSKKNGRIIYKVDCSHAKKALQQTNEYDEEATFEDMDDRFRVAAYSGTC